MKRLLVGIGITVAVGIALGVLVHRVNASEQRAAIANVLSEQEQAATKFQDELQRNRLQAQRDWKDFAQSVQAINASSCPKDFRLAWFDYVSAVTDVSEMSFTRFTVDLSELVAAVKTTDGKLGENAMRDLNSHNRAAECLRQCQRIAISYGVSFHPASLPVNPQQN